MRLEGGDTLVLATHNRGKAEEFAELFKPFDVSVKSAADFGLAEPKETEDSFVGNARLKAHFAARETGLPSLADDSGITIDALGGAPGVYTADWAETPLGRDFLMAMNKTRALVLESGVPGPYPAQFRSTLVLAWPNGQDAVFEGAVSGSLAWPLRGKLGHGYDPMFQPDGYDLTFAEMDAALKNELSHRALAFKQLALACFT
jgi:XTP/dITP diphosphohydrolase